MARLKVHVSRFEGVEVIDHGAGLKLTFTDQDSRIVVVCIPTRTLGDLLASLPAGVEPPDGDVREVRAWSVGGLEQREPGLKLTLQTAEGQSLAFRITPAQIAGIATIATFGGLCPVPRRTIN